MGRDDQDYIKRTSTGLVPGLIVAGMGVLFLLNNLHIIYIHDWWRFWPVILIAMGLTRLVDSPRPNERAGGAVMLIVGVVFLATNLRLVPWPVWEFWPLILIGAGVAMILNRTGVGFHAGSRVRPGRPESNSKPDAIAIFGGFKRQVASDDYRGANYVAIFGGGEIDLRRAQIQGDAAVVDVTAIFGGFELKVPTHWLVVNEVVGVFGGTGDETTQPSPDAPGVKRLIVRGVAIFGGLGIKN
jgi:hypothetical protein